MSARANSSAKAKRAGGATTESNKVDDNSINSSCSIIQNKQPISVKQAIILLNAKVNTISQQLQSNNLNSPTNSPNDVQVGTLEMRSAELQKKNDILTNELTSLKNSVNTDLENHKKSLDNVKDMVLKLQSSVTDLQSTLLKLNKN
jgi:hypothetical protein